VRAIIASLLGVASVMGAATLAQAAPTALHRQAVTNPAITMVRDYCGHGFHRDDKRRDKAGARLGKCVPNKPKAASQPLANSPSLGGTSAQQLNEQELSRLQGGAPPVR
jgi:hypothetical protein